MPMHPPHALSHAFLRPRYLLGLALLLALITLSACGFRLKGTTPLPFDTLYTNISDNTSFGVHLRRVILASSPNTHFVDTRQEAQAVLTQLQAREWMREISIGPDGRVEEYELNLLYRFQLTDAHGRVILPPTTLEARREVPYNPDALQATQGEIGSLFIDMRRSLADRIVRRLNAPHVIDTYRQLQTQLPDTHVVPDEPAQPDGATDTDFVDPASIILPSTADW